MTNAQQWNPTQRRKTIPRGRIERWLGQSYADKLSNDFASWYGPPVNVRDIPGSVWIAPGGEFVGDFKRGEYFSAEDAFEVAMRKAKRARQILDTALGRDALPLYAGAGFASVSDALARASAGFTQMLNGGMVSKVGPTGVAGACFSLWRLPTSPAAGAAGSAAPGGRAPTKATTGAMTFNNPASGTTHLTGADFSATTINNAIMLYDRIYDVAKTMNSTAAESVTGVPTRYQSSTATAMDYAGGNFLFVEVGATAMAATAHNWSSCTYRNQAGTDAQALPSLTGVSGAIADRFDMPLNQWFAPLNAADNGIMDLANIQCSAAVATGSANFVIGHPIGILAFPIISLMMPFDWLTNRSLAPRIFDDACLSMFELPKPNTSASTYSGIFYTTNAA